MATASLPLGAARPAPEISPFPAWRNHAAWPLAGLALVLAFQFWLVFHRAINWDEFFFFSQVEQFGRGELTRALQTIHVRLFAWLTGLPGNGVDQIIAGRLVMLAAEMVILAAIYGIASHFTDRRTGLATALAYLGSIFVFQHGFAFRVDPLAAALCMAALWLLLASRLNLMACLALGLLLALAGMVTIKAVLYAPAFAAIGALRLVRAESRRAMLVRLTGCVAVAALGFAALYAFHAQALSPDEASSAGAIAGRAADYAITPGLANAHILLFHALGSPLLSLLLVFAPFAIWRSARPLEEKLALTGLLACVAVFFVYVNTYPYFYAFILPPLVCAACLAMQQAIARYTLAPIALAFMLSGAALFVRDWESPIAKQRAIVAAAEEIFPGRIAYFDFCGMLARHDKANPFMTNWGMVSYIQAGVPVFRQAMESRVVPLMLVSEQQNYPTFGEMLTTTGRSPYFLDEDAAALRANYIPFWGPYWLAGRIIPADGQERAEHFLVPGPYTVRGDALRINGVMHQDGAVVELDRGLHRLAAQTRAPVRLVWGNRLTAPAAPPPEQPFWRTF